MRQDTMTATEFYKRLEEITEKWITEHGFNRELVEDKAWDAQDNTCSKLQNGTLKEHFDEQAINEFSAGLEALLNNL